MKGLVLCAGLGTRLRPLTYSLPKHLIPVANKPVLRYGIEALVAAGVREIGIVVNPTTRAAIEAAFGAGERAGVDVRFIEQREARGLAHAARCARDFIGADPFIMHLGDTLLPQGFREMVDLFHNELVHAVIAVAPVADPHRYGVVEIDDGRVVRVAEKPAKPASNLAIAGAYLFDARVFEAIDRLAPSWRNEYEITDAIQDMIDTGLAVRASLVKEWWKDTGKPDDVLEANRVMLERAKENIRGRLDDRSSVGGVAVIGARTEIENSQIEGPVAIGAGGRIRNARIGPFASIGDRVEIRDVEVSDSIVMDGCTIEGRGSRIAHSLIGRRVRLKGADRPGPIRLLLGDDCEIELP
jgi:glucose-1-phosphate thymidylyltransferase